MHKDLLAIFGPTIAEVFRRLLDMLLARAGLCPDCEGKVRKIRDGE